MMPKDVSWKMRANERHAVLQIAAQAASRAASQIFRHGFESAQRRTEILQQMKKGAQLLACQNTAVIGMTSTFAALNRDLLQRLASRVVVVEEAGELLECQLMACLSSQNLEQVILIGDHQQLR